MLGTADYIAPEQALNDPDVDIRADIYSLGATFYTLVTGRPPFDGNTTQKLLQHQMKPRPRRCRTWTRRCRRGWRAVVEKMLAKKPDGAVPDPGRGDRRPGPLAGQQPPRPGRAVADQPGPRGGARTPACSSSRPAAAPPA